MEHRKNSSSNDDDRWAAALREMAREQSLVTQLRAMVLPALQLAGGDRGEVVAGMFQSILNCSAKAMAELKLLRTDKFFCDEDAVDDKRRVMKMSSSNGDDEKPRPQRLKRRRRSGVPDDCVTLETPVPDYDGHQWRKYGQKLISNAKHQRSYYKCTYIKEQGCRATKTVQQQQQEGGSADEPAIYAVVYYGHHTCKPGAVTVAAATVGVETAGSTGHSGSSGGADELLARSYSQCSNISVTCTSVVVDHQHHHRTASVESSYDLLDMAGELVDGQLLEVDAFSPLDLDSDWATEMQKLMGS